jgi:hypothetical protein
VAVFQEAPTYLAKWGFLFKSSFIFYPAGVGRSGKATRMNASGSYVVVEFMIREKRIMLLELKDLVDSLERKGLITFREQQALLKLGDRLLPKLSPVPVVSSVTISR